MNPTAYYTQQSKFTTPGEYVDLFTGLPNEIAELCRIVQGLVLHYFNDAASEDRFDELNARHVRTLLDKVAILTQAGNGHYAEMEKLYTEEADLRVPPVIESCRWGEPEPFKVQL